ncbi:type II and III secretion system protein family protein [Anatilimnocola floriformis]|uniref:type II and III secretion system protein family protein n=1 Tax=Anatilimnocola floriformis TaxID=2948575 RepID=UPI0020C4A707|nr:pilus assembly protein N-terminal domain-containing protein [Anatilimnocola floriformis]
MSTRIHPAHLPSRLIANSLSLAVALFAGSALAQPPRAQPLPIPARPETLERQRNLIGEVLETELSLDVEPGHSKLIRTRLPVARSSIVNQTIADVLQLNPNEIEIIGVKEGTTDLTFWFTDADRPGGVQILRYRVKVGRDTTIDRRRLLEYRELETMINEMFPNSSIELVAVADKLIVRGQARDAEEASNIMNLLRKNAATLSQIGASANLAVQQGQAADPHPGSDPLPATNIISLLRVPGEQQVLLKVRVAELSRSALRELGLDFQVASQNFLFSSTLGNAGNLFALLDNGEIELLLRALSTNSYSKVLAEPNLVTLSGRTASFIAGGQFAVPTIVGVNGAQGTSTSFQGFGTQLRFTPTVLDKDRIRLQVAPTFSSLNNDNAVNGIPGLNTRSVFTTVDMREGQWLAIAGLVLDQQNGSRQRVPFLGDLPGGHVIFGKNQVKRDETELLILVSPQLVHPLDADCPPPLLPGMEVKEPTTAAFYLRGLTEGRPDEDHRSTVLPAQRTAVRVGAKQAQQQSRTASQKYFLASPHGLSE